MAGQGAEKIRGSIVDASGGHFNVDAMVAHYITQELQNCVWGEDCLKSLAQPRQEQLLVCRQTRRL